MGIEIERKFLVDPDVFRQGKANYDLLRVYQFYQGYLSNDPWVRVRFAEKDDLAWLTVKGQGAPMTPEWEFDIPCPAAIEMYDTLCKSKLGKIRSVVYFRGHTWHVDQFLGGLEGLWLAEIELKHLNESFEKPPWTMEEVTGNERYSNAWLAEHGLPGGVES